MALEGGNCWTPCWDLTLAAAASKAAGAKKGVAILEGS